MVSLRAPGIQQTSSPAGQTAEAFKERPWNPAGTKKPVRESARRTPGCASVRNMTARIEDYGFISDLRTGALISRQGQY